MSNRNPYNFLVYSYPDHSSSPVLITHEISTREEFFAALASALRLPKQVHRPAPTNLDGMADLLKEANVKKVITSHCRLGSADLTAITRVFDDLGVVLVR